MDQLYQRRQQGSENRTSLKHIKEDVDVIREETNSLKIECVLASRNTRLNVEGEGCLEIKKLTPQ